MKIDVYCDEAYPDLLSSEKPQVRFMLLGSLWLQRDSRNEYKQLWKIRPPASERYVGWDNKKKKHDNGRRVALVMTNYVVIISINKNLKGRFITAFVADSGRTLKMIRKNPKWTKKTADLPGWLSGSLFRFYCHWQRTANKIILFFKTVNYFVISVKLQSMADLFQTSKQNIGKHLKNKREKT